VSGRPDAGSLRRADAPPFLAAGLPAVWRRPPERASGKTATAEGHMPEMEKDGLREPERPPAAAPRGQTPEGPDGDPRPASGDDWRLTRRTFLKGSLVTAGALAAVGSVGADEFLGGLGPAEAAQPATPDTLVRTGHSNNCDGACGHLVHVSDGKVRQVEGAFFEPTTISGEKMPVSYPPRICLRGVSQQENLYSANRVKYPYKRVGERGSGKWKRISWDEAATTIAEELGKAQAKGGKDAVWIAPYTGSLSILEGVVGVGFRLASVIGACAGDFEGDNEGDSATPCGWNYVLADPALTAGGIFDGHESTDFLYSDVIVLAGNNVAETSIPDWRVIVEARAKGATVVSIDPRFTATSAGSDLWLPIRPGTDTALFDGVINHVIQNKLYDEAYLTAYTVAPFLVHQTTKKFVRSGDIGLGGKDDYVVVGADGMPARAADVKHPQLLATSTAGGAAAATAFQLLADRMAQYTPDYVAGITDLKPDDVTTLGRLWGEKHPVGVRAGFALSHWYRGDLTMQAMLTLQALTGNIGVHGGGVTTFAGGLTSTAFDLPAWWAPEGTTMFSVLEPMQFCDAVLEGNPHPVHAAWFMVDNYAQQMSDRNKVMKALEAIDFIVASDYVMSSTADMADIVLPSCTYLEKTDVMSPNSFYLQYMAKAVEPLWESKSDLDQVRLVAEKMGVGQYFDKTPDDYLKEILHIGDPDADGNVNGLTWDQLTSGSYHLNTPTLPYVPFDTKEFPTKSGRIEFYVEMLIPHEQELCDYKEQVEAAAGNPLIKKYPLTFLSTHTRYRTHSQYCDLAWMNEITSDGEGFLEINPADAKGRGLADGEVVRVFNDRGEMKVKVKLTQAIKPGVVNCYQGGWDTVKVKQYIAGHPNNLTHQIANPAQALIPNFQSNAAYYDCLVQVERAEA
jgi:anaerobic dimethyl sulfoxide reductase subunit A